MSDWASGGPARFLAGSRVAGYRLEEALGRGPTGTVYRAVDEQDGHLVALKILAPRVAADEGFTSRLIRDAEAASAIGEPHILPVMRAGEADGAVFVAMPYIAGGDAGSLLRHEGPLDPVRAAPIIWRIASALDTAHQAGLEHGDVKLANILVDTPPGQPDLVYLSDFGHGREPPVSALADQQALACAAFELLTGQPPFQRDAATGMMPLRPTRPPRRPTSLRAGLPSAVDAALGRALLVAPGYGYASCRELADALHEVFWPAAGAAVPGALPAGGEGRAADLAAPSAASVPAVPSAASAQRPPSLVGPAGEPEASSLASPAWGSARPSLLANPDWGSEGASGLLGAEKLPFPSRGHAGGSGRSFPSAGGGTAVTGSADPAGADRGAVPRPAGLPGREPWLMPRAGPRLRIRPFLVAGIAVLVVAVAAIGTIVALGGHSIKPPTLLRVAATSANPPQNGDVWVQYTGGKLASAQVSGRVRGVNAGEVARLYAQPFPFRQKAKPVGSPIALRPAGQAATASYAFLVTPTLATRYRVEVFASVSTPTPLVRSEATTVYVAYSASAASPKACARPTCDSNLSIDVIVPPSTMSTEIAKHWYVYFGLSLSTTSATPSAPATLTEGEGEARAGTAKQLSADEFTVPVSFRFNVGKNGYNWLWNACTQDSEPVDGLGLPGTHGCGTKTIAATVAYLG
jgi:hypothetical protein